MDATSGEAVRSGENGNWSTWKVRRAARLLIPAVLMMLTVSSLLLATRASAAEGVSVPSAHGLDYDARIASDGKRLWFAALGKAKDGKFRTQVMERSGSGWKNLPGSPATSPNYPLLLTVLGRPGSKASTPCIGDTPNKGARVRCHRGGKWKPVEIAKPLKGMNLVGLTSSGRKMTALFSKWSRNPTASHLRVAKLKRGKLETFGPAVGLQGQILAGLGESTRGVKTGAIDVALQLVSTAESGKRVAAKVTANGWKYDNLPAGLAGGSQLSGTVRTGTGLLFPANQDEFRDPVPATFSVFGEDGSTWSQVGGRAVSSRAGYSQGAIDPVGDDVWATWQESRSLGKGNSFRASVRVAKVSRDGRKFTDRKTLWKGDPTGPGITQAVEYRGEPVFGYMKNVDGKTRAAVDFTLAD